MDIRKLRHILVLAREAHFGRAAHRLGITQSALTRSIQTIEAELGLRLFDRGREGVHLTRAGALLVEDAEPVVRRMDVLVRNMGLLAQSAVGEVHCGLGPLTATLLLPEVLTRIAQDHADLRVRTRLGHVAEMQQLLREGELDFAVLSHPLVLHEEQFTLRRIGHMAVGALVRRGHPLAGRSASSEEMAAFPIIAGTPPDCVQMPDYVPTISCDNYEIARAVTLASDAIWIAAESLAGDELAVVRDTTMQVQVVIASLARRTLSPPALLVIDLMSKVLGQQRKSAGERGTGT